MSLLVPQMPPRRRILRTYGRQSVTPTQEDGEPPRKRLRVEAAALPGTPPRREPEPFLPDLPLPELPQPKSGSILAFFKPLTPTPSTDANACEEVVVASAVPVLPPPTTPFTPPSSPSPSTKPRHRRRLTTRPVVTEEPSKSSSEPSQFDSVEIEGANNDLITQSVNEQPAHAEDSTPQGNNWSLGEGGQSLLSQLLANALASKASDSKPSEVKTEKSATKKRKPQPLVQTTLSLSMNPGPGFTICKTCGLLYNHLNEKDRKDHAKWHAGRKQVHFKLDE